MDIHVPYFKAGLENNEFCIWVTSKPLEAEEAKEALRLVVPDIDIYLERGQIEIIPYTQGDVNESIFDSDQLINYWVKKLDQILASGYEGLRTAGSNSWLKKGDWGNFVGYEKKVDATIGKWQMISLCPYFLEMCNAADIIDVACCHQFSLIKREGKWERIENLGRKNIPESKLAEETLNQSEQFVGMKLDSIPFPAQKMDKLELADIVDIQAIQSLMDDFYTLSHVPIGILDIKGNILVGAGWQDICTRFHRIHPETCKHCVESDTELSTGVSSGEFKMYKCKNNMWDIVTPIIVGYQHVGNIFLGQFFFEDEPVDFELFRTQARKYGFNEEEYIAALEKVPRLSRETANTIMIFFMKFANILSYLGYSNLKLAQSLTERDALVDAMQESEEKYRNLIETASEGIWILDAEARTTYVNEKMAEMLGYSQEEMIGKFAWGFADEEGKAILKLNMEKRLQGISEIYEFKLMCKDGSPLWVLISAKPFFNKEGKFTGSLGMFTDITGRKQEEHRICRYNRILEGINKIFSNVVQAKTEEELGSVCLSVALEITGSQFGFINEMGTDGLLHDVAKSELGWEQCLTYDKTEHRSLSSNFAIHGLHGSVIKYEKSFFTNDPQSHPESIGLPSGHPPLTSFLGVPLVQNGKTVGLIAVANRENGYSFEQQEDLEAIAPAVIQALQRKKIEQEQAKAEEALRQSEQRVRLKLESILSPAREIENLELADIVNFQAIQPLMDDFYKLTHIPIGLNDLKGNVLAGSGWQDICTKFHRIHPETCKHCLESDTKLSSGVSPGEFKLYRCKNNMLDIATPIIVGGQHIGNIFLGQFFFEDEPLDYELFRAQARKYGFNEEKYITALQKVPRLSRETVDTGMAFFMTFANMLSQLSFSNIKLAQSLVERDALVDAVSESEKRYRMLFDHSTDAIILSDPRGGGKILSANPAACQMLGWEEEELVGKGRNVMFSLEDTAPNDVLNELQQSGSAKAQLIYRRKDGTRFPGELSTALFTDSNGEPRVVSIVRDITGRKKAEEALRLSNIYNRSLIEASLDPLVTIGPDGKIMDVNGATEQVTGYSRKELIGTDFSDYFTEPEKALKGYQQVFTHGEVRDYLLEIQHKDGHITPVLYNASVYRDETDKVIGVFAAARDITERKKAEEALKKAYDGLEEKVKERTAELEKSYISLKENERRLIEAQKIAHIGNWDWDIVNKKMYWSDEIYRIGRTTPRESGLPYNEFLSCVHPYDRSYVDNAIKEAFNGKPFSIDHRIIAADGEERIIHAHAEVIFDEKNLPVRMRGIAQDITERKRAEEKIQTLANAVESSNDAIVTESLDGTIASWNKAAEQIYGYSAEEILGKNVSILEPDNVKGEIKYFSEKIKQGKKVQNYETVRLRKDGSIINISVTLSPILNASGELVALSAIVRDITERKQADKALRKSEARLRRFYESGMFGVFYYSMDGSITDSNDKFLEMVGYTREDLQAGQVNWNKMTPPEYHLLDEKCIAELKATGVYAPYEKEYIRKDGSHVPIILGAATFDQLRNEGIAFVLDNTERKRTEQALAEMDRIRIKEIHHRIKNNLQVISSLLDLQAEKFDDEKVREAFREGQNRVISMSLIHEELYKGKGNDTFDFSAYLRKLAENLFQTYSLSSKNIRLLMDLEEGAFFNMDTAVPLGIIVNELVSNSLKHAFNEGKEGEIRIQLCREGKSEEMNKSLFSLMISDNGTGVPENLELESFESLGLKLVSILVDQLDGKIELKRDQGAEFRIIFNVSEIS
jgi:PAS domain S-box-containing protein